MKLEGFKGLERVTFGFGNVVQQAAIVTVMYDFVGVARF